MSDEPEPMDTKQVLGQLNAALEMQLRSLLQFTQASGSMFGIEVQGVGAKRPGHDSKASAAGSQPDKLPPSV